MKNEDKQNDGGSPLRNIVLVIKNFFTKILSQSDGLSVKSLAIANNWKKKLAPIVIKYIKELLPFIKRMKDSTTMLARKTGAKTIELSLRIKRFLPNFISGFLGKIFKHVSGFLGKMFRYISAIVRTCFNKIKYVLRKTYHFFQVLFSPIIWLINFIWSLRILIAIGLVVFLVWDRVAQSPSINIMDDDIRLSTTQMSIGEISEFVKTSGKLVPEREEKLFSKVDLPLKKVYVKYGDLVEEGQLLLELDSDIIEAEIKSFEQNISVITGNYNQALKKAKLNKDLLDKGFISKDEYELSSRRPEQILVARSNEEVVLKKLKSQLLNTKFISPIKGRIDYIDPGITKENAERGGVKIGIYKWYFTISSSNDELNLNLSIDGRDVSKVKVGQEVMFRVDSFKQRVFYGKIVKIIEPLNLKPHTNKAPVFYELIATIDEKEVKLKSGLSVDAEIKIQTKTGIKRIPRSALRFVPPKDIEVKDPPPTNDTTLIVWIANADNSISAVPIETGIKDNQFIEVPDNTKISLEDSIVIGAYVPQAKKKGKFALPQPKRY